MKSLSANQVISEKIEAVLNERVLTPPGIAHSEILIEESGGLRTLRATDPIIGQFAAQQFELMSARQVQAYAYSVIEQAQMEKIIRQDIEKVAFLADVSNAEAQIILHHFQWSLTNFCENYFSLENPRTECGLPAQISEPEKADECLICGESDVNMMSPLCGHSFCANCWKEDISVLIHSQTTSRMYCMKDKCKQILDYEFIKSVADQTAFDRYWYFVTKEYVEKSYFYTLCPNPNCNRIINYTGIGKMSRADCSCGTYFCFRCGKETHEPVSCVEFENFEARASKDDESLKKIHATAKPCPKCTWPTERNAGCNHMTCIKCMFQWCWMCCGDWNTHGSNTGGFYSCNLYEKSDQKKRDEQAVVDLKESEHFLDSYNKYYNHNRSATEMLPLQEKIMGEWNQSFLKASGGPNDEWVSLISHSLDLCYQTRKLLGRAYIYLFFHDKEFNFMQKNLSTYSFCSLEAMVEEVFGLVNISAAQISNVSEQIDIVRNKAAALAKMMRNHSDGIVKRFAIYAYSDNYLEKSLIYPDFSGSLYLQPESAFDKKGLVYFIGTKGHTEPFQNPTKLGFVKCFRSSNGNGKPEDVLDYRGVGHWTGSESNAWWSVDFGPYSIIPTHYCVWSDIGSGKLRNWRFEGSQNGTDWRPLISHTNDLTLSANNKQAMWSLSTEATFFSHFRILQFGPNSDGTNYLTISAFEIYGQVKIASTSQLNN